MAEAWSEFEAALTPCNRLRVKIASIILGKRLFVLQRNVWKAAGERDAWLHTVEQEARSDG